MDLLVAQLDHGTGRGRTTGGDIATQSSYANQNYFNKRIFLGCCVLVLLCERAVLEKSEGCPRSRF
jgi:hypothetical protein